MEIHSNSPKLYYGFKVSLAYRNYKLSPNSEKENFSNTNIHVGVPDGEPKSFSSWYFWNSRVFNILFLAFQLVWVGSEYLRSDTRALTALPPLLLFGWWAHEYKQFPN